jgi:hypothetical protein
MQDCVAVGDVDYAVILGDLGDKIARVQIVRDWHAQPEDEAVGVVLHNLYEQEGTSQPAGYHQDGPVRPPPWLARTQGSEGKGPGGWVDGVDVHGVVLRCSTHLFHVCLGLGVKAAGEVGRVGLSVPGAIPGMLLVVLVDAAGREDGAVDALEITTVGQVEGANDVGPHRLLFVVLAPVDVGATCTASRVEHMSRPDPVKLLHDLLAVLVADDGGMHILALLLEDAPEVASDPALATPDEEAVGLGLAGAVHAVRSHLLMSASL